tara:strand:- start:1040 stop:2020 length:981 start_codon:yes stop_codon:yes gene_type:complete
MNSLKESILKHRKITNSSLNVYVKNLDKLSLDITGKKWKNASFLKNYPIIIKNLEEKSLSTRKNYLSSILVGLSPKGRGIYKKGYSKIASQYTIYLKEQGIIYDKKIMEQKKSQKESDSWVTMEELKLVRNDYRKSIKKLGYNQKNNILRKKKHFDLIQKYLVASLYILQKPRRLEYANMKMINKLEFDKLTDEEKENNNYLVMGGLLRNKKFFHFGDYKTKKTYGIQTIEINKELNTVLNLWRKINSTEYLLLDSKRNKLSCNGLTRLLHKTFKPTGKNISSTMIRHIYLTEKYGDETSYLEKKKDADEMGHSINEQQKIYVKIN